MQIPNHAERHKIEIEKLANKMVNNYSESINFSFLGYQTLISKNGKLAQVNINELTKKQISKDNDFLR